LLDLRRFAQVHGYTIYKEYVEHESGGTGKRSGFQALFADVSQGCCVLVLFCASAIKEYYLTSSHSFADWLTSAELGHVFGARVALGYAKTLAC
jgi:hypothetical protein